MSAVSEAANVFFPEQFPAEWASAWGEDEYGLWMALEIGAARQVFRWILPGTFLMGSPETELERYENETQHEVTLTRGLWLADTACTQALWQAVMEDNPSNFKDPSNPVETVSWEDAQRFIAALNQRGAGLNACLPSEAQWEYACRAGTSTPFSFGENITPEQVNYDANHPYAGGKNGLYRQRTVPEGSLPPNGWGLHEMHGNVWEWCEDRYGEYGDGSKVDPRGAPEGADRVLRGGSWVHDGGGVRSAGRGGYGPAGRNVNFGFRLALGHRAGEHEAPAREPGGTPGGKAGAGVG
jgi:formylglycine-generating enzyme